MKHIGYAFTLFIVLVLSATIIVSMGHKSNRDNEMKNALDIAMDNTLENLKGSENYTIETREEFVADFMQDLLLQIESASSVNVTIKKADIGKGVLSVEVIMSYYYSNGSIGKVSTERTIILDKAVKVVQEN